MEEARHERSVTKRTDATLGHLTILIVVMTSWAGMAWAVPFAYITNPSTNSVTVLDTATNSVLGTIAVGSSPEGVAVNPGRERFRHLQGIGRKAQTYPSAYIPREPVSDSAVMKNIAGYNQMARGDQAGAVQTFQECIQQFPRFEWP